jgi:hypothetical protein
MNGIDLKTRLRAAAASVGAALLLCLAAPGGVAAQDQPADPDEGTLKFFRDTEVGGLVDAYYDYYSTKTDAVFRNFDTKHNAFSLSMAELWVTKPATDDSRVGYRVRLNFGPAASNFINAGDPGGAPYFNIEEAYGTYRADVGTGLDITFGKWVTTAGAEVIEAKDNWNYSRGLLFALAIPYFHAGIKVNYAPSDKVSFLLGVANGWNNVEDNNTGKTFLASLYLTPREGLSITENYIGGPEQTGTNDGARHLSDTVVSYAVNDKVSVLANYDYGHDGGADASWQGIAGYLKYQATPLVAVIPRIEYFDDPDGFSTGTPQGLTDFTLTFEVKPGDNFIWRIEYRGDFSDTAVFETSGGEFKKNQHSIGFGFLYSFSSKS